MTTSITNEALTIGDIHEALRENRRSSNGYLLRDSLPSPLAVKQYYLQLKSHPSRLDFDEAGLSIFSQNNEDGILMYILSRIGIKTKRCIEIGCDLSGSSIGIPEGNSINLIVNFGFDGLIVDIDPAKTAAIRHFFSQALSTKHFHSPENNGLPAGYFSPAIATQEITAENINDVYAESGFTGEIDFMSIDVDGADVRIWDAVKIVDPRIVMIEVNNRLPFDIPVYGTATTSDAPRHTLEFQTSYGSSLAAACEVGKAKGYTLVGMDVTLINAFFVRNDLVDGLDRRTPDDYTGHRMNPMRKR